MKRMSRRTAPISSPGPVLAKGCRWAAAVPWQMLLPLKEGYTRAAGSLRLQSLTLMLQAKHQPRRN